MGFFQETFYGNSLAQWAVTLFVVLLTLVGLLIIRNIIITRLKALASRTKTQIDDIILNLLRSTRFIVLLVLAVYTGSLFLTLPEKLSEILKIIVVLSLIFQAALWGNSLINWWVENYKKRKMEKDPAEATAIGALGFVSKLSLWALVALWALDNMGVDITGLIAGLGITGIAVALALQNILGDLFASLSIVLDKPFVIGDFIIVDNYLGTVEHVGLKTTRVRSLYGEQLVFSNSDLLNSRIRNYKRMYERRVVFTIGVTYQTPAEKLEKIPRIIREAIEAQENARFDRAHFKEFGDFSLNYEIVYYVTQPDYIVYMDIQQAINLILVRKFEEEGIEFAYPTQTLFVSMENSQSQVKEGVKT